MQHKKIHLLASMLLTMLFCLVFPQTGAAATQPTLYLNGSSIKLPEPVIMVSNSVMIPIRVVSEELGYKVDWNQKARTISIKNGTSTILLTVDKNTASINGKTTQLDVAPMVKNGSTLVPLRFVGESLGLKVDWDNESKSVYLFTSDEGSVVNPPDTGNGNSGETTPPSTGDVLVKDFDFFSNTLHIALGRDVEPKIMSMTNPDRIVIDFPNSKFSDEFNEKFGFDNNGQGEMPITDYPDVQKVRFAMFSTTPNTTRFVIDANYKLDSKVTRNGQGLVSIELSASTGGTTNPTNPTKPTKPDGKYTVVVDAGHGAHDSGAVSVRKRYEKDLNLQIANKVAELAVKEEKLNIVLTRSTDVFLELSERAKIANDLQADLFVSIHANSIDNKPTVSGTETYYYRSESKAFAELMHKYLIKGTQFKDRNAKVADHHVTRNTKMPAILLEIGFLTNPDEEAVMFTEDFQYRVAQQIVNGLKAQLGLS
ncbi:N-acetylmuramoyl-L-alanine amidase family protein [Paenibacillus sp. UMB4589-SE434]|uniref:N-acetylmuramoyl-L-alanine amidase family protein n=1 Tax=Paenibacillus sp. UMB4589-SE434 TaxID=3046314 RepID=UPI00254C4180|nr:N-acetylmuramoyl-L-alanine amidase family protein [Paenibacillus sp. UMB4589-SE434]MDK8179696.1 N-acetylmuramoyl-L-alanine amidase family protein [Paenibacillus sp. UMB4589-SE434]